MLYIDVTSSCKSPLNTGIQRVVRGIVATLQQRVPVTPLLWSPKLNSYCRLPSREQTFLVRPFAQHQQAAPKPERLANPYPWSPALRYLRFRRHRVALGALATPSDTLLIPEIFQDNRQEYFRSQMERFPGKKYALFYDAITLRFPEFTAPQRQIGFAGYVQSLASFDKVICISNEVEADLRHYWAVDAFRPTATAILGLPTDFGQPRANPQPNFGSRRVLYVATLERRKNHLTLLSASEKLWKAGMPFELVLIGRSTADWGETVLAEIERLKQQGRPIHWLQHVSDDQLHQAYRECAFTVFPSLREGFGMPILESLWHGRPCICASEGAIGEVSSGGGCYPIHPADANSIADAIRLLLTNQSVYDQLFAEACARRFRTWDEYAEALIREIGLT